MNRPLLSYFIDYLSYDPLTGNFTNLQDRPHIEKGTIAGNLNDHGYIVIWFKNTKYLAHRLAWLFMTKEWPKEDIDHRDRVRNNNVWTNLREATGYEQNQNTSRYKNNTSGFTGVSWHNAAKAWRAEIQIHGKREYSFHPTPEAASEWYKEQKSKLHLFNPQLIGVE